jgi:hypothetical protein
MLNKIVCELQNGEIEQEEAIRNALRNSNSSTQYISEVFGVSEEKVIKILEDL